MPPNLPEQPQSVFRLSGCLHRLLLFHYRFHPFHFPDHRFRSFHFLHSGCLHRMDLYRNYFLSYLFLQSEADCQAVRNCCQAESVKHVAVPADSVIVRFLYRYFDFPPDFVLPAAVLLAVPLPDSLHPVLLPAVFHPLLLDSLGFPY